MESFWWLFIVAFLVIIELITLGLTTIWFAIGALAAYFSALAGASIVVQIIVFVVVSVVMLALTRPFAKKYVNKNVQKTNVDSMIGKTARVVADIDNAKETGTCVLEGIEWMARSADDSKIIHKEELVVIERIEGVKLIVNKKEN